MTCPPEPVEHLTAVVRQALDEPDLTMDFFHAGGNSLVALTLARTAQLHGFRLGIQALLRAPSLHRFVRETATTAPAVVRAGRPSGRAPLLPFQRWMLRLDQEAAARLAVVSRWRTSDPVDPRDVAEAVRALPALHDALRTRIVRAGDGTAHQAETGERMLDVDVVAADRLGPATDVPALAAASRRRLDPYAGPTTVATMLADPAGGHTELVLVTQHAVSDFVSHEILMAEVEAILRGDDPSRMGDTTTSHHWATLLERYQTSGEILAEQEYWRDVLHRSWRGPYAQHAAVGEGTGRRATAEFDASERAAVGVLRRTLGLTPTELMLMAASLVLGDGRRHLLVGMSTHGRYPAFDGVELHSTVGWLSSNVAVAVPPVGADPVWWRDRLRAELAEIPHHGIGVFGAEWVRPPDELTRLLDSVTPLVSLNVVHAAPRPDRRWQVNLRTGQGTVVRPRGPAVRLSVLTGDGSAEDVRVSVDYNDAYLAADVATGIVDRLAAAPGELAERFGLDAGESGVPA
ncbi:condensation domain-containing protein [Plantactinospora endophytica]|uniref:condensation domain-containing protein n=1 Tax=Plantactinospora endophytica TaxID=673535 RepID=UPI00194597C6|nr:condensation domain-containing protein [Plantactinospora endophytica]